MKTHEFYITYEPELTYTVELYDAPWYVELPFQFFEWLDPCCRRPWWIWTWLVRPHHSIMQNRYRKYRTGFVTVSREWAVQHYDWDVQATEKEHEDDDK